MSDAEDYHDSDDDYSDNNDDDVFADEEEEDYNYSEGAKPQPIAAKYLDSQTLIQTMNEIIHSISSLLSLPSDSCSILLRNFNWDVLKLQDVWFSDQFEACKSAGLILKNEIQQEEDQNPKSKKIKGNSICPICFDCFDYNELASAVCGHLFCKICWEQYITIAINDGAGCVTLRCPDPECYVSVDESLINMSISEDLKGKYTRLLVNNFVECSKGIKWCPAPGCQYAVQFTSYSGQEDVVCKCSYSFCWDCVRESHRPVDCQTAIKWHEKNNSDSLNTEWILCHSKPCPKCHRSIEKNQGCNHMSCTPPCKHNFCWICLGDWSQHKDFYNCNKLQKEEQSEENRGREIAKISWQKYTHYYERWMINNSSWLKANECLNKFKAQTMLKLFEFYSETESGMEWSFIRAWKQIIECRRVLKWTYAYGYYLTDEQDEKRTSLFEDLQGQAESALERLHYCVEKELERYIKKVNKYVEEEEAEAETVKDLSKEFHTYKLKVIELTNTTRKFFDNLVHGLETGLI